jgi:hypothetical protein
MIKFKMKNKKLKIKYKMKIKITKQNKLIYHKIMIKFRVMKSIKIIKLKKNSKNSLKIPNENSFLYNIEILT